MRSLAVAVGLLLWSACPGFTADYVTESVVGYGASMLSDRNIEARLAARFKARGRPVFLMASPSRGLAQGDLLRFSDKAVLIDADVWQTLQAEGALPQLLRSQGSVVQLRARAREGAWTERRRLVGTPHERKGYALGAQLLRALQEAGGGGALKGRLQLAFEGNDLVLLASRSFLDALGTMRDPEACAEPRAVSPRPFLVTSGLPARVVADAPFHWRAWALDSAGGPSRNLRVDLLSSLPEGMAWTPSTRVLQGRWPQGEWSLELAATAAGRADTLRTRIVSWRNRPPRIVFDPPPARAGEPWTLIPVVSDSDHPAGEVRLRLLEAPAGASWDPLAGRLDWTPPPWARRDPYRVRFLATDPVGDSTEGVLEFSVSREGSGRVAVQASPDRPPTWLSELGTGRIRLGDTLRYRPLARDPEDDSLQIVCQGDSAEGTVWDGQRLWFAPARTGWIRARCVATDSAGNAVPQELALRARAAHDRRWWLAHQRNATAAPWEVGVSSGAGRMGLLVVDPRRTFLWKSWSEQDWPMLFVGMDLLGGGREGNRLWLDVGGVLRCPAARFFTGGVMGRLEGVFHPLGPSAPLVVEPSLLAWVHQALLMVDTTGWRYTATGIDSLRVVLDIRDRYQPVGRQILSDAYDPRNAVVLTRIDAWWEFHRHLEAGPAWWREDRLVGASFRQYLGAGVRSRWSWSRMHLAPSAVAGWGAGNSGWGGRADLRLEIP